MDIILATSNPHKIDELRAILNHLAPAVRLRGLQDLGRTFTEPVEHGNTFEMNAAIKALDYARQTGLMCLADDSGLEVDALAGRPGVISSHYCTDGLETGMTREERDRRNNDRLLGDLTGVPAEHRTARFVCVMALAESGRLLAVRRGTFEGRIGIPPRVPAGEQGFGYDPLFLVAPDFARTGAELAPQEKNRRSHRAAAAVAIASFLAAIPG